jgi:hypothetical protein
MMRVPEGEWRKIELDTLCDFETKGDSPVGADHDYIPRILTTQHLKK